MALLLEAPQTQRKPVLLLAALHDRILAGAPHPLAAYYASVGGTRRPDGDLGPLLRDFVHREDAALRALIRSRTTQTNETGRCAVLRPALQTLATRLGGTDDQPVEPGVVRIRLQRRLDPRRRSLRLRRWGPGDARRARRCAVDPQRLAGGAPRRAARCVTLAGQPPHGRRPASHRSRRRRRGPVAPRVSLAGDAARRERLDRAPLRCTTASVAAGAIGGWALGPGALAR